MGRALRVAIIGGGVIGSLTAWMLKRRGATPVVLERGRMGSESSWAGAGILWPINPWLYPDAFTRLVDASLAMYPGLQAELERIAGMSIERVVNGLLVPFFPDDGGRHRAAALDWSARSGWRVEELEAASLRRAEPVLSPHARGALYWPDVAQVRNPRLLQAVHRALAADAVEVHEGANVTALRMKNGRLRGVCLADGVHVPADAVLLAAGSWSGELAAQIGFSLPVSPVKGQIILLRSDPGRLRHIVKHDRAYFVPRRDGRILVGASMENVGFRRGNTVRVIQRLMQALTDMAPGLEDAEVERQWMGFRPGSPDGLPYMGPVPGMPGLWVASGHYRNGVALAPVTARIMSDWILGRPPELDVSAFRVDRESSASAELGYPAA